MFQCGHREDCDTVERIVSQVEAELSEITNSGEFGRYRDFISDYAGAVLHRNTDQFRHGYCDEYTWHLQHGEGTCTRHFLRKLCIHHSIECQN